LASSVHRVFGVDPYLLGVRDNRKVPGKLHLDSLFWVIQGQLIAETSLDKVIVDTTVQPKAVEHPTDARLYRKVHAAILRIAEKEGIALRQRYRKLMARVFQKHGGYAKAKQYNRARPVLRRLKNMAGRCFATLSGR
jgi:IS5 family transposase